MNYNSKQVIEDLLDILTKIEADVNSLDFSQAQANIKGLIIKAKELLGVVRNEGLAIFLAEEILSGVSEPQKPATQYIQPQPVAVASRVLPPGFYGVHISQPVYSPEDDFMGS